MLAACRYQGLYLYSAVELRKNSSFAETCHMYRVFMIKWNKVAVSRAD